MFSNPKSPFWTIFPCRWLQPLTQQWIINIEGLYEKKIHAFYDQTMLFGLHKK